MSNRTREIIEQEYINKCAELGQAVFKQEQLYEEIPMLKSEIFELNQEAIALAKANKEEVK